MYVLCTLVLLSLHNLFKRPKVQEPFEPKAIEGPEQHRPDVPKLGRKKRNKHHFHEGSGPVETSRVSRQHDFERCLDGPSRASKRRSVHLDNAHERRKKSQPVQRCGLLGPAVMYGTRKTWDVGHTPCLQELWNKDLSLDVSASSLDILMSDGEEESSFLSLPNTVLQRHCLTSDLSETATSEQQKLLIQTLQERVCEFQARLRSEDAAKRLLLQRLQTHDRQLNQDIHQNDEHSSINQEPREQLRLQDGQLNQAASPTGVRSSGVLTQRPVDFPSAVQVSKVHSQEQLQKDKGEQLALITGLRTQVKELEEKLLDQTQEVERLRSELGATDLEKQLEVLESENQRLKQELKASQTQTSCSTSHCPHSQDVEALRGELCRKDEECRERERRLAALEQQVQERTGVVVQLQQQLEEAAQRRHQIQLQLEEASRLRSQSEEQLTSRLQDAEEALSRQAVLTPHVKIVTKTVEVESAQCKQALMEAQARNQALQEQLSVQRQLLRELEQQLHESQRTSSQLRQQLRTDRGRLYGLLSKAVGGGNNEVTHRLSKILVYEGEMERAQGQLEAEMQSLEEEKNRVIEEAFIRAESEMKAVHENLAGVRMNLLTLQPALRTLTCDYNCLKRQVQDFPYMLEKAISEAKQEICQVIGEVSSANQELLRKYKREMNLRKKCHNELVRLKGNIRVLCRVRPICAGETDAADTKNIVTFDPDDDAVLILSNKGKLMTFELDKVFPTQATQEEVFQEVQSLVTSCIDGFNVCIFAYGQTGSGKTYTMEVCHVAKFHPQTNKKKVKFYYMYNVCIMAYGQTGSGKTHTMIGSEDPTAAVQDSQQGIIPKAANELFKLISEKPADSHTVEMSVVEVYNNEVMDLLARDEDGVTVGVKREVITTSTGTSEVPCLTYELVRSSAEVMQLINSVLKLRSHSPTLVHMDSSRSHFIVTLTVTSKSPDALALARRLQNARQDVQRVSQKEWWSPRCRRAASSRSSSPASSPCHSPSHSPCPSPRPSITQPPIKTKLQLVDLAGSECVGMSGVTGAALWESSCINRSLSALSDVLGALAERRPHVPYRNSKLTHLLQDAIGGDAKLLIMLCVSPTQRFLTESLQSLGFGARARQVQREPPRRKNTALKMK
ncbi:kinesin-like protein KIFC3 [Puntigrus tetrazona]|uniref:kinesin-like protein KIFC3 n=1 Tax=Puntigrus tetrazona TaxID=1606681 RepID=UPI001C8A099D|nr:kinesin-like protein KIFC3 [Puntigrus tetrazona]